MKTVIEPQCQHVTNGRCKFCENPMRAYSILPFDDAPPKLTKVFESGITIPRSFI